MASEPLTDQFVIALLYRLMGRLGGAQIFLFGPKGDPFWAARTPVTRFELSVLSEALDLLETSERDHPRPFVGRDPGGRFVCAALDSKEDLYAVILAGAGEALPAEDRVMTVRQELAPHAPAIRQTWLAAQS